MLKSMRSQRIGHDLLAEQEKPFPIDQHCAIMCYKKYRTFWILKQEVH